MARFMPALHVYGEVGIFPYQFPVVWGIGQVARGDFALDARLGVASESDGLFKTLVARGEPVDKLKPTSIRLDLNVVFSIYPHNENSIAQIWKSASINFTFFSFLSRA